METVYVIKIEDPLSNGKMTKIHFEIRKDVFFIAVIRHLFTFNISIYFISFCCIIIKFTNIWHFMLW